VDLGFPGPKHPRLSRRCPPPHHAPSFSTHLYRIVESSIRLVCIIIFDNFILHILSRVWLSFSPNAFYPFAVKLSSAFLIILRPFLHACTCSFLADFITTLVFPRFIPHPSFLALRFLFTPLNFHRTLTLVHRSDLYRFTIINNTSSCCLSFPFTSSDHIPFAIACVHHGLRFFRLEEIAFTKVHTVTPTRYIAV
jgi:hypothetical protein